MPETRGSREKRRSDDATVQREEGPLAKRTRSSYSREGASFEPVALASEPRRSQRGQSSERTQPAARRARSESGAAAGPGAEAGPSAAQGAAGASGQGADMDRGRRWDDGDDEERVRPALAPARALPKPVLRLTRCPRSRRTMSSAGTSPAPRGGRRQRLPASRGPRRPAAHGLALHAHSLTDSAAMPQRPARAPEEAGWRL